jgi:hypothetical protein
MTLDTAVRLAVGLSLSFAIVVVLLVRAWKLLGFTSRTTETCFERRLRLLNPKEYRRRQAARGKPVQPVIEQRTDEDEATQAVLEAHEVIEAAERFKAGHPDVVPLITMPKLGCRGRLETRN